MPPLRASCAAQRGTAGSAGLAAFELVDDDAIDDAARLLALHAHTLAEGAGAAGLAGLLARTAARVGSPNTSAVVVTGGNVSADEWRRLAAVHD